MVTSCLNDREEIDRRDDGKKAAGRIKGRAMKLLRFYRKRPKTEKIFDPV